MHGARIACAPITRAVRPAHHVRDAVLTAQSRSASCDSHSPTRPSSARIALGQLSSNHQLSSNGKAKTAKRALMCLQAGSACHSVLSAWCLRSRLAVCGANRHLYEDLFGSDDSDDDDAIDDATPPSPPKVPPGLGPYGYFRWAQRASDLPQGISDADRPRCPS